MSQLAQFFEVQINEQKLNKILQDIVAIQQEHTRILNGLKTISDQVYFQQKVNSLVDPLLKATSGSIINVLNQRIQKLDQKLSEDIHQVDKKYKRKSEIIEVIVKDNIGQEVEVMNSELTNMKAQLFEQRQKIESELQRKFQQKMSNNSQEILKCQQSIISIYKSQRDLYTKILEPPQLCRVIKRQNSLQPTFQSLEFGGIIQKLEQESMQIKKKFVLFMKNCNLKGNRENANLLYTAISEKVAHIESQLEEIKKNHSNTAIVIEPKEKVLYANPSQQFLKVPSERGLQRKKTSQLKCMEQKEDLDEKIENVKNLILAIDEKTHNKIQQVDNQIQTSLWTLKHTIDKIDRKIKLLENRPQLTETIQQSAVSTIFKSIRSFEMQLRDKMERFVSQQRLKQYSQSIQRKIEALQVQINEKARKKQTREAIIYLQEKIKDVVTLLFSLQQNINKSNEEGSVFRYLSYDKQSLSNKENKLEVHYSPRELKTNKMMRSKTREQKREMRKSNGVC